MKLDSGSPYLLTWPTERREICPLIEPMWVTLSTPGVQWGREAWGWGRVAEKLILADGGLVTLVPSPAEMEVA